MENNESTKEQYEQFKNHVIGVLENIIELIKAEEYEKIYDHTAYSPAGDGYGSHNHYINFACHENDEVDIDETIYKLQMLKKDQYE